MDITDMSELESNSFDIAIDKSTIDALLCGDDAFVKVAQMLKETQRVLKTETGVYFTISYGKPESRSFHFTQPFLSLANREFILYDSQCSTDEEKQEKSHYIYVGTKLTDADQMSELYFDQCLEQMMADSELQRCIEAEETAKNGGVTAANQNNSNSASSASDGEDEIVVQANVVEQQKNNDEEEKEQQATTIALKNKEETIDDHTMPASQLQASSSSSALRD